MFRNIQLQNHSMKQQQCSLSDQFRSQQAKGFCQKLCDFCSGPGKVSEDCKQGKGHTVFFRAFVEQCNYILKFSNDEHKIINSRLLYDKLIIAPQFCIQLALKALKSL